MRFRPNRDLIVTLLLVMACHQTASDKAAALMTNAATLPADFCSPLGDPIPSSLSGANAFALCKVGDRLNTRLWGPVTQNFIRCKPDTLRANWKWVIYCNADGSHCACNRDSIVASPADATCCAFKAGDHCTVNGQGRPGKNGCEAW
jgi:hypothetical protein